MRKKPLALALAVASSPSAFPYPAWQLPLIRRLIQTGELVPVYKFGVVGKSAASLPQAFILNLF